LCAVAARVRSIRRRRFSRVKRTQTGSCAARVLRNRPSALGDHFVYSVFIEDNMVVAARLDNRIVNLHAFFRENKMKLIGAEPRRSCYN